MQKKFYIVIRLSTKNIIDFICFYFYKKKYIKKLMYGTVKIQKFVFISSAKTTLKKIVIGLRKNDINYANKLYNFFFA